ncbi:MAG: oligosaccharide flippase family protein [Alphaproteobacteria bacterium]|nr:oligosaccharide flippase family protein [Alphaproteobacteria bacterium]
MSETKRALIFSFINKYSNIIIQFAVVMVIARLLTPKEIGIYSITAAFFGFGQMIRDFGISTYIIQEKELTKEKVASAMTVSLVTCYTLAALFYVAALPIAQFYGQPEISGLLKILCLDLLFIPFGTLTLSILKREMRFEKILIIDFISTIIYACTAVILAMNAFGVFSLAYAAFAGTLGTVLSSLLFRPKWVPWLPSVKQLKSVLGFGWKMSLANIFSHIHEVSGDLVLGKTLGANSVALFNRGFSTVRLFTQLISQSVNPVLSSVMAKKNRADEGVKDIYIMALTYTIVLAWPFFLFISMNAELVLVTLYGEQWVDVKVLLPILALMFSANILFSFYGQFLVSTGLVKENLRLVIYTTLFKVAVLLGFSVADLKIIVIALLTTPLFKFLLIKRGLVEKLGLTFYDFTKPLYFGLVVSAVTGGTILLAQIITDSFEHQWQQLMFLVSSVAITWLSSIILLKHPISDSLIKPLVTKLGQLFIRYQR